MKIAIGSDHRGIKLKASLIKYLEKQGVQVTDMGPKTEGSCDYPEFAFKVAKAIAKKNVDQGILICNSGLGMTMAASTVKGIRAANCLDVSMGRFAREHNDANVLVLAAGYLSIQTAKKILKVWLKTKFAGGRHARRVKMFSK